ncbi:hypothetical protein YPPY01_2696, partial [Yersinia pestis PY-01]
MLRSSSLGRDITR